MRVATRRGLLAGAGTVVGGSLATVLLTRKPRHPVLQIAAAGAEPLRGADALVPAAQATPMPSFVFDDAAGRAHSLAEFAGRGVVLNVWATWCAPCVAEMPSLAVLAGRLAQHGVVVLPLSIDRGGAAAVQAFFAAHGITGLAIWTDPDGAAQRALGVEGVPSTFVVDRQGRKAAVLEGGIDWASDAARAAVMRLV